VPSNHGGNASDPPRFHTPSTLRRPTIDAPPPTAHRHSEH
jgi:hypothetical protein